MALYHRIVISLYHSIKKCLATSLRSQALILLSGMSLHLNAQKIATLEVALDRPTASLAIPASINLDAVTHLADSALTLVEVKGKERIPVDFQIQANPHRELTWFVQGNAAKLRYELLKKESQNEEVDFVSVERNDGYLTVKAGNKDLLRYQFETLMPPPGISDVFQRSGFIHPLWSPRGHVLTRIQPPDHYHHYGIWNPWTHVLFDGDTVDFWNLHAKQGTVRFANLISITNGNIFGQYAVIHDHIAYGTAGIEKVAIREVQTVRVYAPREQTGYYIADVTVQMDCPEGDVRLLEYRYGGFGWRATEEWTKENSRVLSSEGKTRKEADGSRARWCMVEGAVGGENAGVVMMSYPANYNHPEPLRIWPEDANGKRGDMFANFSPTKDRDWQLKSGSNYVLRYRLLVFNGQFTREKAEAAWQYFASPPAVKIIKTGSLE